MLPEYRTTYITPINLAKFYKISTHIFYILIQFFTEIKIIVKEQRTEEY